MTTLWSEKLRAENSFPAEGGAKPFPTEGGAKQHLTKVAQVQTWGCSRARDMFVTPGNAPGIAFAAWILQHLLGSAAHSSYLPSRTKKRDAQLKIS